MAKQVLATMLSGFIVNTAHTDMNIRTLLLNTKKLRIQWTNREQLTYRRLLRSPFLLRKPS